MAQLQSGRVELNTDKGDKQGPVTIGALVAERRRLFVDYLTAVSGSAGRLVFSLVYFIALANTLSIAEFGLFATASAAGVMLSRILAFGFISALYRIATVKPQLIGTYTAGFLVLALCSLPLLAVASLAVHGLFFGNQLPLRTFTLVIVAEALLWRPVEVVLIVNNGMNRFGRAAFMAIAGTAMRAVAALLFAFQPDHALAGWALFYLGANAVSLAAAVALLYPRQRLRFRPALYLRRLTDSLYVAGAEILFYLQMEFDKLLILAFGGPSLAGIYAIIMRLVDLTAIPIRTFSMMLVQRLMRAPEMLRAVKARAALEASVFAVSTVALLSLGTLLHFFPAMLGRNVAEAAPLVVLALLVPGFRNLVEYQAELLFGRGQTLVRAVNLGLLTALKAVALIWVLERFGVPSDLVLALNGVFSRLLLASSLLTHSAMRLPSRAL
jgi:O-antigen/teichoic acid export membrane protein